MAARAKREGEARKNESASRTVAAPPVASSANRTVGGITDLLLQRMASVVLDSGVGVVRGRTARGPRWANDAFLKMSGFAATDLYGLSWSAIAASGVLAPAATPGEIAPTVEQEFIRKDGSRWPVIVSRGIDPTDPAQLILFVVDLTASRIAEAARRAADSRYARFFEVSNVAFWTADAEGRARLSSATTAERLGTEVELDSATAQAELIHPDDRTLAAATWSRAIERGEPYDLEVRARGLDGGDHRWTRLRAFPDSVNGVVVGWYGTTEDIHERRLAADALAESEQRFKRLADEIPAMVWLTDGAGQTTYLSRAWYAYTGQAEAEAMGRGWLAAILPDDLPRLNTLLPTMQQGQNFDLDFRLRGADGGYRWMLSSGRPRFDISGAVIGYAGALTDIHDRKVAERELEETQLRLSRALDGTGVGVWEWDAATDSVSVSGSALNISGIESQSDQYLQVDYRAAVHPDDRARLLAAMTDYVDGRSEEFTVEVRIRKRDGGWIWVLDRGTATSRDANGRAERMVGTLTNINDGKRAEERLRWTVDHDGLTGLASRTLLHARLDAALAAGGPVALALLDIDDFKRVNDDLGHAAGDALLIELAQRLADFAYPNETVARLGGDEFTLVIPGCGDISQTIKRLERLRTRLAEPFVHEGRTLSCRSSIGVALAPHDGEDASTLLRSADIAMYSVKAGGPGAVALYSPALGARARGDSATISGVREALEAGTIMPFYDPVVRLDDRSLAGLEAIPHLAGDRALDIHILDVLAGDPALSAALGDTVMDQVLADFAQWRSLGCAPGFVSVNVALSELRRPDYAERLLGRLAAHAMTPEQLRIEIVETGLHSERAGSSSETTLAALHQGGILAGLDRFGSGASSLSHLSRLPLAAVKIDRQFTHGVEVPGKHRTIVRAIAGLGISFGLRVVAMGVMAAAEADALKGLGCTYGQGPFFGQPGDAATTQKLLQPN